MFFYFEKPSFSWCMMSLKGGIVNLSWSFSLPLLLAFVLMEPKSDGGILGVWQFLKNRRKRDFPDPQLQGSFQRFCFLEMVSPFASVSGNISASIRGTSGFPCNNHLCCERSLLLYQTVRADFCLAGAYCLLLLSLPKRTNPTVIHSQAMKSYFIYPCIPVSLLLLR